jgi:alpha-methylacyl-CoA racemase
MGALSGVKIVELAGIGPGPFCCMLLADMGAEVVRVDRAVNVGKDDDKVKFNVLLRGRRNVAVDLKNPEGVETVLKLIDKADALIEGFRPGVMERLGLGPDVAAKRNPKLVYGRMTGWGQTGPVAHTAGHDINYISLSGALHAIGENDRPPAPPLNLVGDFGGGALYMAVGVLAGIIEARTSGKGQVIDCSMVEGSASLMSSMYGALAAGTWVEERGKNRLDKGAHYYNVYETRDGKYISVGSIEPQFYDLLLEHTGLKGKQIPAQLDRPNWPTNRETLKEIFKTKTRDEWDAIMGQTDICFAPVVSMSEAMEHPHNVARQSFIDVDGVKQPRPAPVFMKTPSSVPHGPARAGEHTESILGDWGFAAAEIAKLKATGAVKQA